MDRDSVRVLIVDDHTIFREALAFFLERQPGIEVVGAAADATQAVEQALAHGAEVVLMDISLPGIDGFEATRRLRAAGSAAKVIALTGLARGDIRDEMEAAGIDGYLGKDRIHEHVVVAVMDAVSK